MRRNTALSRSPSRSVSRSGDTVIRATVVCPGDVATEILDKRPHPPSAAARPLMIQREDLGEMMVYLATLHPRVVIEQIIVRPTAREY